MKRDKRETALPEGYEEIDMGSRPDLDYKRRQQRELLIQAVAALPYKQRLTFNLRYFDQMKFGEIARVLGVSASAGQTNFAEAVAKLKKRLG